MIRNLVASALLLICMCLSVCPSATQSPTDSQCIDCQPPWINVLQRFRLLTNLVPKAPLCKYGVKTLFTACQPKPDQQVCPSKENVTFHCCSISCLPLLQKCLGGTGFTTTDSVCIPSNLSNWRGDILKIYASDMATRKMSGNV